MVPWYPRCVSSRELPASIYHGTLYSKMVHVDSRAIAAKLRCQPSGTFTLIIPGHGDHRRGGILARSIASIRAQWHEPCFSCHVFVYEKELHVAQSIESACAVHRATGYWTDFMKLAGPQTSDHVALMMDDIDATKVDTVALVRARQKHDFDVVTPAVSPDWRWPVMTALDTCAIRRVDYIDMLLPVFRRSAFRCWQRAIDTSVNRLGWGYDVTLQHVCGASLGVMDSQRIIHTNSWAQGSRVSYDTAEAKRQLHAWLHRVLPADHLGLKFDEQHPAASELVRLAHKRAVCLEPLSPSANRTGPGRARGTGGRGRGRRRGTRALAHEAVAVIRNMMFIHIPKTGGMSMQALLSRPQSLWQQTARDDRGRFVLDLRALGPRWLSKWHLPPDVYMRLTNKSVDAMMAQHSSKFCIVRDPAERYQSELKWQRTPLPHAKAAANGWAWAKNQRELYGFRLSPEELANTLSLGRFRQTWTEEIIHMQPQHWFVWDEEGRAQCDCVIAFEKLSAFKSHGLGHRNRSPQPSTLLSTPMPSVMRPLVQPDYLLWNRAKSAPHLCYEPPHWQDFVVRFGKQLIV